VGARPPAQGFGRTLLEAAVAYELGGTSRLEFRHDGVAYTLEASLAAGAETGGASAEAATVHAIAATLGTA
jgi:hypothetical protein